MGGQLSLSQDRETMRTHFFPFSYLAFGLVVLSLAAIRGEEEGDRIVGGSEVEAHSIPWQVGLMNKGADWIFCGGTIISATKILTAAHCQKDASSIEVIVGEHSLVSATDGVRHEATTFVNHPQYNGNTLDNDFAVITLAVPIELGDKAAAASLPTTATILEVGQPLTVSGWGALSSGGGSPNVLHAVQVPYITNEVCSESYSEYGGVTSNMLCAGNVEEGGVDSCQGDSGGPLTTHNTIVGVVSWGIGCAWAGRPGVYARVSEQMQFLCDQEITEACGQEQPEEPDTTEEPEMPEEPENPDPSTCNLAWVADGICDARNNHAGCFYDGNDCCDKMEGYDEFCHNKVDGCKCRKEHKEAWKDCQVPEWAHDWFCDDENNTPECNYDGGDCCTKKHEYWDYYCDDCQCIFPNSNSTAAQ